MKVRGHALLLNYTATSYHWGCYGTSLELYRSLVAAGYAVMVLPVEETHAIKTTPASAGELFSHSFHTRFVSENKLLSQFLADSDIIVVNGEGTLHRSHPGPMNLLAMIAVATLRFNRPVHLVNHSCFPAGDDGEAAPAIEDCYKSVLALCRSLVAREPLTFARYNNWGLPASLGFDCLPLSDSCADSPPPNHVGICRDAIVVGGASYWPGNGHGTRFAQALRQALPPGTRVVFLGGGCRREPAEDVNYTYPEMCAEHAEIEYSRPTSLRSWMDEIRTARLLVTGRFHHVVAAAAVGTPTISMPGNTPKIDGVMKLLGWPAVLNPGERDFVDQMVERLRTAYAGSAPRTSCAQQAQLRILAQQNFAWA